VSHTAALTTRTHTLVAICGQLPSQLWRSGRAHSSRFGSLKKSVSQGYSRCWRIGATWPPRPNLPARLLVPGDEAGGSFRCACQPPRHDQQP
jgi:hypothetical protein